MILQEYLSENLESTVMIALSIDNSKTFQYNYWNWLTKDNQLHLLCDDFSIGHIIHIESYIINSDGSLSHNSKLHPKKCNMQFYFGGNLS